MPRDFFGEQTAGVRFLAGIALAGLSHSALTAKLIVPSAIRMVLADPSNAKTIGTLFIH
jgi:hypothetical protein